MTQQTINIGTAANDGTGDTGRTGGIKINENFTELYDLVGVGVLKLDGSTAMTGAVDTTVGTFTSSVAATGNAFDFDSDNAITTGKLFNFSSNGTDILSLLDDGTITTLKFQRSTIFDDNILETAASLGTFTFKEAIGKTIMLDPINGIIDATNASNKVTFAVNGADIFDVTTTQFRPASDNTVDLGTGVLTWKKAFIGQILEFGYTGETNIVQISQVRNTGLKIGTATNKPIAFFNSTPVVQPSSTGENAGYSAVGGTNVDHQDTFTGNVGSSAYTINDIVKHLKNLGLIAA